MLSEMPGRIGRYDIDRRIGAGGMALTYRCRLEGLGGFRKKVVVKVLHPDHVGDEQYVQMFLDEARLSARLHHANVAQVFEVGDDHGVPYMVMEFVNGPNLASVSRRIGPFGERPYGLIAHALAGVARGLGHAHSLRGDDGELLGIVHRDVSLGNIVVSREGVVKLIDFGIAKWNDKVDQTEVGLLKGKLHYMAPEQLSGEADHLVDVYQLGVCLYWLSTGRPPFHDADPAKVWKMRLEGDLRRPSSIVPDYPPELEEIVMTALATSKTDRWASATELADMLEAFSYSHPRFAADDERVSAWIRDVVPPEDFEEPSSRPIHPTTSTRSLGELVMESASGRVAPVPPPEGMSELTMRPESEAGPQEMRPMWMVVAASVGATLVLVGLLLMGSMMLGSGDHDAQVFITEAERLLEEEGDREAAAELLHLAEEAGPTNADLIVRLERIKRAVEAAP